MKSLDFKSKLTLLISSSLSVMSISAISPALPQIALAYKDTPNAEFLSKFMLTITSLIIAIFAPIAGYVIDKGFRKVQFIASLIVFGLMGTTGLYLESLQAIIISRVILGIGVAGILTSLETYIGDFCIGEERSKMLGLQGAFISYGGVIYVALAGFLATVSWRIPFSLFGLAFLIVLPALFFVHEPTHRHDAMPDMNRTDALDAESIHYATHWQIAGIASIVFLGMLCIYAIPTQLPFLLRFHGIDSPAKAGLIVSLAMFSAGSSSYMMPILKKRLSFPRLGSVSFLCLSLGFLGLSLSSDYAVMMLFAVCVGTGIGLLMPTMRLWVISIAAPRLRGRSVGLITSSLYLGQFLSPIIAQPIVGSHGITSLYTIIGCTTLLIALSLLFQSKKS